MSSAILPPATPVRTAATMAASLLDQALARPLVARVTCRPL